MCPMLDKIKFERMRGMTTPPAAVASKLGNRHRTYLTKLGVGYGVRFVMYLVWPIEAVHLGFKHIIHHRTHTYFRAACSVYGVF